MSQFIEMFGDPVSWQTDTSLPTLNDTVNVISGFPFDSEKFDTEGVGTPLIRIRDIQRGYSETFTTEVFDEQYRIKKYELLVGMDGMFDIARWQSDEAALNQRVCCLRMKGSENDTFIQYLVQPILKHIENGTNATTVKHISTKQINGIRVPIASHEQKNKFAMIANQADKSGFDGRKSQFIEMFKHKKPNGKIADLVDANIKSVKKSFNKEDMIEYIDISSVNAKYRTLNEATQYIVASAPSRAQQCVQNGDILVSTVRPINRNVAVVNSNLTNLVASTGFCVLRPIDGYREYLLAIVTSDKYTEKMCDIASGGLYPAVNNSDVLSYDIFIPDKDFLHRVTQIYQQADKSGFELRKSIDAIDAVIKSLINS